MSVMLGSGGKVLLGPSGTVAIDPTCCCGETPHCPCIYTLLFGPCCEGDPIDGCTDTLTIDDGCGASGGCSGNTVDYFTTRFRTITVTNTGCNSLSGSCTIVYRVNDSCDVEEISCSGRIVDSGGVCHEGCDVDCATPCSGSGTIPDTYQVTVYSEPCIFSVGACLIGGGCSQVTPIECDYLGGIFLGEGSPCP